MIRRCANLGLTSLLAAALAVAGCSDATESVGPDNGNVTGDEGNGSDEGGADVGPDVPGPGTDEGGEPDGVPPEGDDGTPDQGEPPGDADGPDGAVDPDGAIEPDEGPGEPTGYEAEELMIRITDPSGLPVAGVIGQVATVGGILFGDADTVTWQSQTGASGEISEGPFWRSGPIDLQPGDNVITVTATAGTVVVSDTITITYNPSFKFDGPLVARPNIGWVGESQAIIFTIPLGLYANFIPSSVTLYETDADGNITGTVQSMVDDGNVGSSGDEIQADGVFSRKATVSCSEAGPKHYRVGVDVEQGGAATYEALSPVTRVWCVEHFTPTECSGHQSIIQQAETQATGGTPIDDIVTALKQNPAVADAGTSSGDDGYSIWIQFESGVLGAVLLAPPGMRGSGGPAPPSGPPPAPLGNLVELGTRNAIVLAPFFSEFAATDDAPSVAAAIAASECPAYALEGGTPLQNAQASLERFRSLSNFGIISISTHGDALFGSMDVNTKTNDYYWDHVGSQEVIWSGEAVGCNQLLQTTQNCTVSGGDPTGGCPNGTVCLVTSGSGGSTSSGVCVDRTQADLRLGRVVLTNKGYAMTPAFFQEYAQGGFPKSIVNLGACRTFFNGSLASVLFGFGAKSITGFSGYVDSEWAREQVVKMFEGSVGKGLVGQFHEGGEDPSNPGTHWRLLGAGNLDLSRSEIINNSFETGDPTGWRRDGDGRVISQLGSSIPVHGKFMGLLSTGLGFTVQTGTLEQDFCIPEDKSSVEIYWKFFSEEFKEYCGSAYQDTFQAVLTGAGGQLTLVDVKIDDLCGYGDGSCGSCPNPTSCSVNCMGGGGCEYDENTGTCSGSYPCECGKYFIGLTPSDVNFDQGGVFNVLWQKTTKNVKALAGAGKVNLRLYATDTGDSIFDTVILVDSINFN